MLTVIEFSTDVSLGQLMAASVTLLTVVIIAWGNMRVNMATFSTKLLELEERVNQERRDNKDSFNKVETKIDVNFNKLDVKLDRILENQTAVAVQLANKEDRK